MRDTEQLVEELAGHLKEAGLDAVTAWQEESRARAGDAVVSVSLRGVKSRESGFQGYLGERYNEELGRWEDRYGKELEITFALDVWGATARQVRMGAEKLRLSMEQGGPEGMTAVEFSSGETGYDSRERRYVCPAQAVFRVWAEIWTGEEGSFLDFEVRGESKA